MWVIKLKAASQIPEPPTPKKGSKGDLLMKKNPNRCHDCLNVNLGIYETTKCYFVDIKNSLMCGAAAVPKRNPKVYQMKRRVADGRGGKKAGIPSN